MPEENRYNIRFYNILKDLALRAKKENVKVHTRNLQTPISFLNTVSLK